MQNFMSQSKEKNKKTSNLAKMMAQMDQAKTESKEDIYELLKKPRSKEYIRLVAKQQELTAKMEEIQQKLEELPPVEEITSIAQEIPIQQKITVEEKGWWEEEIESSGPEVEVALQDDTSAQQEIIDKQNKQQEQREELEAQYQKLQVLLEESREALKAQLPISSGLVGLIYPSDKQAKLMNYGVIAAPGNAYHSPQELLEQVKPKSEQEEKQWLKGNNCYKEYYSDTLLDIEVYLFAICVVYEDGPCKVIKSEM